MGRADYITDDAVINLADFRPSPNQSEYFVFLFIFRRRCTAYNLRND